MHHLGHRKRLRERFLQSPETLREYEIVELILGHAIQRRDTKPMAKELLARFGSLRGVLDAKPEEYADIPGLGQGTTAFLALLKECICRYVESPVRARTELCTPAQVAMMARERLASATHEEVWIAYVDGRNRLIHWNRCSQGGPSVARINCRDIVEKGLALKASGFILVHNHPGGDPRPSAEDRDITAQLDRSARTVFLRFIDHLIICDSGCFSLMTDGLM